jgi:hypothetical protein
MSAQMHYRKDVDLFLLNTIDNTVRKAVYKTPPSTFFYDRPGSWVDEEGMGPGLAKTHLSFL